MDEKEFCSSRRKNRRTLINNIFTLPYFTNGTTKLHQSSRSPATNKFRETLGINISTEGGNSFGLQQQVLADQSSMSPPRGGRCPGKVTCNSRNRGGQVTRDCHARVYIPCTRARAVVGKNGQTLTNRSPFHNSSSIASYSLFLFSYFIKIYQINES